MTRAVRSPWSIAYGTVLAATVGFALICIRAYWDTFNGDAAIYWVFAKSAWANGFFSFGPGGPQHGATSPLWAGILMAVYPACGDQFDCYKALGLAALLAAVVATLRLGWYVTGVPWAGTTAAVVLLLHSKLQRASIDGFETPLFIALLAEAMLATLGLVRTPATTRPSNGRLAVWAILTSLLPLARPEGAVFLVICGTAVVLARRKTLIREPTVVVAALVVVPSALFYLWMYSATGQLVPASIRGRYLLSSARDAFIGGQLVERRNILALGLGTIAPPSIAGGTIYSAVHGILVVVGAVALWRQSRIAALTLGAAIVALTAGLWNNNPGWVYVYRYSAPIAPLGIVLAVNGGRVVATWLCERLEWRGVAIGGIVLRGALLAALVALLVIPGARLWRDAAGRHIHWGPDTVLDRAGTALLNEYLRPEDRILVFEVQVQYDAKFRTVSVDGIIGGEILPYLVTGDLVDFIRRHGITHVSVSGAYDFRSIYHGTLLQRLWQRDAQVSRGEVVELDGLRFVKIVGRGQPRWMSHWWSVYKVVQPAGSS